MAITSVSNLSFGARSVSFTAVASGADTLALSVVSAAMLAAQANLATSPSAIYSFLTTSHTDAAGTAEAFAEEGAILDAGARSANVAVYIGGNNSLSISGAATVSVRIALASSIAS